MPFPKNVEAAESILANTSAAFLGTVVSITPLGSESNTDGATRKGWAMIQVHDAIKGVEAETTQLVYVDAESCGMGLSHGETYFLLTYPQGGNSRLTFGGCGAVQLDVPSEAGTDMAAYRTDFVNNLMLLYRQAAQ